MATETLQCPHCRQQVFPEDLFCAACGAQVEGGPTVPVDELTPGTLTRALFLEQGKQPLGQCVACARPVLADDHFCSICGTSQSGSGRQAPAPESSGDMWEEVLRRLREATLGEYEIAGKLGSGGMAAVFLAHEIALNRKVAIKVMAPTFLVDAGLVERFRQEARTVAALRHPNIVNIHAVREVDHLHFFVMQFIAGRALSEIVKQDGALPIPLVAAILFQVGSALAYAHRRGVIHRDIKPANIMLDDEGNAIVTDFGIAKVAESPQYTMTGGTIGTPAYMSPEQCNAAGITGASDQYSLGIVAYELLTGAPPFSGPHYSVMGAHVMEPPPPIQDRRPDCPMAMAAAVTRMLAKAPDDRFPSPSEAAVAAGGGPLADDDPIRQELIALAARSQSRAQELRASTPASPLPRQVSQPTGPRVAGIQVGQLEELLPVGKAVRLGVRVTDAAGIELTSLPLAWQSDAPAIASVQPDGTVIGHSPGTATITVACQGQVATSRIRVRGPVAARLDVNPVTARLTQGRSLQLGVAVTAANGEPVTAAPVTWQSTDPEIAIVSAAGVLTAVAPGSTTIVARCDAASASVAVEVTGTRPRPTAAAGTVTSAAPASTGRLVRWGAGIGAAIALVVLVVIADPFGWRRTQDAAAPRGGTGTGTVTPTPRVPHQVALTLTADTVAVADSARITAEVRDSAGALLDEAVPEWSSDAPTVVAVDGAGSSALLRALAPGRAGITARIGAVSQEAMVVVRAPEPRGLDLTAARRELAVGDSVRLSVGGPSRGGGRVEFRSSRPDVATVSVDGMVRALRPGSVEIIAARGGERARLGLTVRAAVQLSLLPASLDLDVGETGRVAAQGSGTGPLRWSVSDSTRVRVTVFGAAEASVTALAPGTAEVRATAGGGASARIPVRVRGREVLQLSSAQVAFETTTGATAPPPQTIAVTHVGGGEVTVSEPEYLSTGGAWLAVQLQGGVLTVRPVAAASGLGPGQYSARVVLSAGKLRETLSVGLTVKDRAQPVTASKAELQQVLDDYAAAINAGDSLRIRRVYPAIARRGLDDLLEIAKSRGSASYDLRLRGEPKPAAEPGTMQGEVIALFLGGKRSGGITNIYIFGRQDGRWVISSWKPLRK
jgi:eukaryotic-like serine/threonine-protein kinase